MFKNIAVSLLGLTLLFGTMGCNTDLTDEQKLVIADGAGMLVSTSWIAIDGPSGTDMQNVAMAIDEIQAAVSNVGAGVPFSDALYPVAAEWIGRNVEAQQQPLALAGVGVILTGVDMFFATNPEYLEDSAEAISILNAFLSGAKKGLLLSPNHPAMLRARSSNAMRVQALSGQ